jgi:hypothetical protein
MDYYFIWDVTMHHAFKCETYILPKTKLKKGKEKAEQSDL